MEDWRVGIIAEGKSDHAVIANVLKGALGIDRSQIQFLVPELSKDETDLAKEEKPSTKFSNWTIVKQHCIDKQEINRFYTESERFYEQILLVIQIDTAERNLVGYEVFEPEKSLDTDYSLNLRNNVIEKLEEWLGAEVPDLHFAYAIPIEETEAWVLPVYFQAKKDTCSFLNVKEKLFKELNKKLSKKDRQILSIKDAFRVYDHLSNPLKKKKILTKARLKNKSLNLFCTSIEELSSIE